MKQIHFPKLLMSLGMLFSVACTSATEQYDASSSAAPTLVFENVTIDPVAVYRIAPVEPRKRARLRIPGFAKLSGATNLRVVAVPLGTVRNTDGTPDPYDAVSSEFEPAQHLVSMLWSLSGRTLVSMALPRGRR